MSVAAHEKIITNSMLRYRELSSELLSERLRRELTQEEESEFAARLDSLWSSMTRSERDILEEFLLEDLAQMPSDSAPPSIQLMLPFESQTG